MDEIEIKEQTKDTIRKIKETVKEEDPKLSSTLTLRTILGGDFLVGRFLRGQIRFILLLMLLGIAYITNRYVAQQEIIEEESLRKELTEKKNYMLTQYSELTEQSRQSILEQRLRAIGDSTLIAPKEPPFFIPKK